MREEEISNVGLDEEMIQRVAEQEDINPNKGSMFMDLDLEHGDPYVELERQHQNQPIFKLPNDLKERNKEAYEPKVVSIGPYHYGKPHLMPAEVHKRRALIHFVKRSGVPMETHVSELMKIVDELKMSYAELDDAIWQDDNRFVKLMILDGCFILEFLGYRSHMREDYARIDPMFTDLGIMTHMGVLHDFLLVENQLPLLVLSTLYSTGASTPSRPTLYDFLGICFGDVKGPCIHMLDFYTKGRRMDNHITYFSWKNHEVTYSAAELHLFGIRFEIVALIEDIKFDENTAIFYLPIMSFHEKTKQLYLNMLAFKLREGKSLVLFNAYIRLMDVLVNSAKDVRVLESQRILINNLSSEQDVVEMIKEIRKETLPIVYPDAEISLAIDQVTEYCHRRKIRRKLNDWSSYLHENYFKNPWTLISVAAAVVLLVLTVIQTVYTVRSFNLT